MVIDFDTLGAVLTLAVYGAFGLVVVWVVVFVLSNELKCLL